MAPSLNISSWNARMKPRSWTYEAVRLVVKPEFRAKALSVNRPAFSESIVIAKAPETRQPFLLALNGYLEMVAGKGFV